jgi:hypothetical protein
MAKKVVLDVLIDALDMQSDEVTAYLDWYVGGAGFSGSQHPVWPVVAGTVLPFKILD